MQLIKIPPLIKRPLLIPIRTITKIIVAEHIQRSVWKLVGVEVYEATIMGN